MQLFFRKTNIFLWTQRLSKLWRKLAICFVSYAPDPLHHKSFLHHDITEVIDPTIELLVKERMNMSALLHKIPLQNEW